MTPNSISSDVQILVRQILQLVPAADLQWPQGDVLIEPVNQEYIFDQCFQDDRSNGIPPIKYRLHILKILVKKLENAVLDPDEDEVSDSIMMALSLLMTGASISDTEAAQHKSWVTYTYSSPMSHQQENLRILENRSVISGSGTTGLRTWEAALHLANYLLKSRASLDTIADKIVLELGAGTGLLSMLAAYSLRAGQVICTDGSEEVVDNIKSSIAINNKPGEIRTAVLRWGWTFLDTVLAEYKKQKIDVVLGADVTYDQRAIPALVGTFRDIFECWPAAEVIISATIRNTDTFAAFDKACALNNFRCCLIDFPIVPSDQQKQLFYKSDVPIKIVKIRNALET